MALQPSRARRLWKAALYGGGAALGLQGLLLARQPAWRAAAAPAKKGEAHPEVPGAGGKKTVFVVGGGVAGVCSAHRLARRGYEVVVLEGLGAAAARGSSSATAAGGMDRFHKFSSSKDWVNMMGQLAPFGEQFRFFYISWLDVAGDLFFWRWLARFASESLFVRSSYPGEKKERFSPLVVWGVDQTVATMDEVPGLRDASHYQEAGSVMVLGSSSAGYGGFATGAPVSAEEVKDFEPLVSGGSADAKFIVNRETRIGECGAFTRHLAAFCLAELPVRIVRHTAVQGFTVRGSRVTGIQTSRGYVDVGEGTVVLCPGAWSGIVCDMLGVFCPIYPLKGYTVEVALEGAPSLRRLAYDAAVYAVPAGPRLRIASVGGLGGWDVSVDATIEAAVKKEAERLVPSLAEQIHRSPCVAGLRPFAADELPLVGRVPGYSNVHLNTGPGHSGWKCAAGFAEILARGVSGEPAVDVPGAAMVDPAGRMGSAWTGARLIRELRSSFGF